MACFHTTQWVEEKIKTAKPEGKHLEALVEGNDPYHMGGTWFTVAAGASGDWILTTHGHYYKCSEVKEWRVWHDGTNWDLIELKEQDGAGIGDLAAAEQTAALHADSGRWAVVGEVVNRRLGEAAGSGGPFVCAEVR